MIKPEYDNKKSIAVNVKALFAFVRWLYSEMSIGRVPQNKEELQNNINKVNQTQSIAFVVLAENGQIDDVTASEHTEVFEEWQTGINYKVGNLRQHEGKLYRCLQDHTSQEDWTPDKTPSLWKLTSDPADEYPEWSQPIGAADAYQSGDKVSHNGKRWTSNVDNNVWEPGVYGWNEVTE